MKKFSIVNGVLLLAMAPFLAQAASIQFVGVPTGVNDGSFYVTPYEITIDGLDQLVTCYDVYDEVNFGDHWDANLLTLAQASVSGFFAANTDALSQYERVAWLNAQPYQNTEEQIGLQYAIWNVFGTAPATPVSLHYGAQADAAAATGYAGFSFSNVRFIEQTGGVAKQPGTEQAFVYWGTSPGPSPFDTSQVLTPNVPEPGSGMLLALGLALTAGVTLMTRPVRSRLS